MARKGASNLTNQAHKELEKQRKENYYNNRYKEAEKLTNDILEYRQQLEDIIKDDTHKYISIEAFITRDIEKLSIPEKLLKAFEEPIKPVIRKSSIIEKLFKNPKEKYENYVYEISNNYSNKYKLYDDSETKRKNKIELLIKEHELRSSEIINTKNQLYKSGDINILTSYKRAILNSVKYPFEFEKDINIGYCKATKKLVIDYLLPSNKIIPRIKTYEYKKLKDEVTSKDLNDKEVNKMYNDVIFSMVIKSIGSIFSHDIHNNIDNIVFNGYTKDIDLATGQDIKPYVVSATVDKDIYNSLDLCKIDKLRCLKETMQSRVSINSNQELKTIIPLCNIDYLNKSISSSNSINLLEVNPFELEDLVVTLFTNMAYDVEGTTKTNDGGIDFKLKDNDPITGGNLVGQVKRYKHNIDIPKLREFESVVRNSAAMKGIFISTSNFSPQCERFASENNIKLINGSELVSLFNTYGISSYIQ